MMLSFVRNAVMVVVSIFLGYSAVHYAVYGLPPWAGESRVGLTVEIRGARNVPVANARVSLATPVKQVLGVTDRLGRLSTEVRLPHGQLATLVAEGVAFRLEKRLMIPKRPRADMVVRLDPTSVALGDVTLRSRTLERLDREHRENSQNASSRVNRREALTIRLVGTSPRPEHDLPRIRQMVTVLEKVYASSLQTRGLARIELRPLWAGEAYWEVLGLDHNGKSRSGVFIKAARMSLKDGEWLHRLLTFSLDNDGFFAGGKLRVISANSDQVRLYFNGIYVPRQVYRTRVEFALPTNPGKQSAVVLIKADDSLVGQVISQEKMRSGWVWDFSSTAISRKQRASSAL